MTIPEVEWPILPEGYRWRIGKEEYPTEFGPWYSDEYYVFIEKKHTWTALRWFKKVQKTRWSRITQHMVCETDETPAAILDTKNVETAAYKALDALKTLFARKEAEEKFFGTHP